MFNQVKEDPAPIGGEQAGKQQTSDTNQSRSLPSFQTSLINNVSNKSFNKSESRINTCEEHHNTEGCEHSWTFTNGGCNRHSNKCQTNITCLVVSKISLDLEISNSSPNSKTSKKSINEIKKTDYDAINNDWFLSLIVRSISKHCSNTNSNREEHLSIGILEQVFIS